MIEFAFIGLIFWATGSIHGATTGPFGDTERWMLLFTILLAIGYILLL